MIVCDDGEAHQDKFRDRIVGPTYNTPEGSLNCGRHSLPRVRGFARSKANQLGPGECESRSYEHREDTFESMSEWARVVPFRTSDVVVEDSS